MGGFIPMETQSAVVFLVESRGKYVSCGRQEIKKYELV